tara:strand:+ start:147 stop:590 length:444 start_codon:yes stop_codon:yes gene_type:complete
MKTEQISYGKYDTFDDFDEVTIFDTHLDGYVKSTFHYPAVVDLDGNLKSDPVFKVNLSKEKCKWRWDHVKRDTLLSLEYKTNRDRYIVLPYKKYVSGFEVNVNVHHNDKEGNDISDDDVIKQLKALIKNVKEHGYLPWTEITYTEET